MIVHFQKCVIDLVKLPYVSEELRVILLNINVGKGIRGNTFIKLTSIGNGPREKDLTAQFIYIQYKKRLDNSSPNT